MKIAHVMAGEDFGSAELQIERLARALSAAGVVQRLLIAPRGDRARRLTITGLDVTEVELPGRFAFMSRRRLDAEFARFTPDVVVSWSPEVTALVDRGGYAHVARLGDGSKPVDYQASVGVFTAYKTRADAALAAGWSADKLKVIANLPSYVLPREPISAIDRKSLFTPPTARIVFTAGRLIEDKGFDVLIDAVARLTSVYIWIAGDGADRAKFEQHALDRGMKPRVRFVGWQDDLRTYFAAADLFVLPGRQDDMSDLVVEAWAAGKPVIATDTLGPGLLIRDHDNGILAPVGNAKALAEAIRRVLADSALAKKLADAGTATVKADFGAEKMVAAYLDFFRSLVTK
ncbi:MAG: glycosyltransferase [Alphaproteobacteria bacterium]|nr:glycosyltransferase [Alphaproteobacteria bacterium]